MYELRDLQKAPLEEKFYRQQLVKSPAPSDSHYFLVERIEKTKTEKGKKFVFVKFLYYPDKFSRWLPIENVIVSK